MFGKWGLFVLAALASAAVLTSSAGAVTQGSGTINLSTRAGVVQYLAAHGINARGVVVQRGLHNYAGPNCPGRGWTCTTAKRVLQIAATAAASNTFVCTVGSTGSSQTPPDDCVIVQNAQTGANTAVCTENSAAPNANQSCQVSQDSTSGTNKVTITQAVNIGMGSSQSLNQYAGVLQSNVDGANMVTLGQGITATVNQVDGTGTQTQDAHQGVYLSQYISGTGANTATVNQSQSLKAAAQLKPSLTQKQNTNPDANGSYVNTNISLSQTSGTGANTATVNQSNVYVGNVQQAATASQQQGSPGAGEAEFFTQTSGGGLNKIGGQQTESQTQRADRIGSLTQLQYGPLWADPDQTGGGTGDTYNLGQSSTQNATKPNTQEDNEYADCSTDGTCTANQFISQNGFTNSNTCTVTNGFCDINNSVTLSVDGHSPNTCNSDLDQGPCIPSGGAGVPPPPPPFPPAFNEIG